jgi:hypothetical protein
MSKVYLSDGAGLHKIQRPLVLMICCGWPPKFLPVNPSLKYFVENKNSLLDKPSAKTVRNQPQLFRISLSKFAI